MTTASPPPAIRRRFRFGLRTLLVVVTLAAVGSWAYWIGWPWWTAYWEQLRFESAVKQLKVGASLDSERGSIPFKAYLGGPIIAMAFEEARSGFNRYYGLSVFYLRNATYFVVYSYPKERPDEKTVRQWPCSKVQVFRLPPVPKDYLKHREAHSASRVAPPGIILETLEKAYLGDFMNFYNIYGERLQSYSIPNELIYSDPPAKPEAK